MDIKDSVFSESTVYAFVKSIFLPALRPAFCKSVPAIFYNFFFRQFLFSFLPGKIPVTKVDHPLDEKIPFVPSWVAIYIDFVQFWIRMLSFFIRRFGRKAYIPIRDFIYSVGDLYKYAAQAYTRNLSTTKRPFYIARPRFFLIHMVDPHLFCIPSLHVMVVIHTFLMFSAIAKKLGAEDALKKQAEEMKQGALAISQAILYVKQHSVNCIPAALYAMTCFSPDMFTQKEAEDFTNLLFSPPPEKNETLKNCKVHPSAAPKGKITEEDKELIKKHIFSLYCRFLEEKKTAKDWTDPLVRFLQTYKYE